MPTDVPRDRLRELLDAALDDEHGSLQQMAAGAHLSPFHFARQVTRGAGESPVALRRRVLLERAAWQLRGGARVTDVALAAGYDTPDGFARAFARAYGRPPSVPVEGDLRLPAPNGLHFHPPGSLWIHAGEATLDAVTEALLQHDLDDTAAVLAVAADLTHEQLSAPRRHGLTVLEWSGEEASLAQVLDGLVTSKEVWLAAVGGDPPPDPGTAASSGPTLLQRFDDVARRWEAMVRDLGARRAWDDVVVDALCDPPESFVLATVVAHDLVVGAGRRLVARAMLRELGREPGDGDPILTHRARLAAQRPHPDQTPARTRVPEDR
ncbi:helix-turn-helix domain-containing protein [Nocardioides sp.]|uniref:helix-turn-helix domain-containing protein n=1 Tax=Nocardioides sp. TaxID=35761 RepID=UPI003518163F